MRRVMAWSLTVSGVGAVVCAALAAVLPAPQPDAPRLYTRPHAVPRLYPADSLARLAVSRDLFRTARRPSALAYDPQRAAAPVESYQVPKPALALVGLVTGADPSAVVEGWPGIEGSRVVRGGDVVAGLRVKQIGRDRVVIVGMDTMWVLKVREPWNE